MDARKEALHELAHEESSGLFGTVKDFFKGLADRVLASVESVQPSVKEDAEAKALVGLKEYAYLAQRLQLGHRLTRAEKRAMRKLEGPDTRGSAIVAGVPYVVLPNGMFIRAETKETTLARRRAQTRLRMQGGMY